MKNKITVGFGNNGQTEDYVAGNEFLSDFFGIDDIFLPTVTDNITNGDIEDSYFVDDDEPENDSSQDGGTVLAEYSSAWCGWVQKYSFTSTEWDGVKNISLEADTYKHLSITTTNFVQADMDLSGTYFGSNLNLLNLKRSNIVTGCGCDTILITSATNSTSWINTHNIATGHGNDKVIIGAGDEDLIGTGASMVTRVDGSLTATKVWLGSGCDKFYSADDFLSMDTVRGGKGNDLIVTGGGDDVLRGGSGRDILKGGTGNDELYGGSGRDKLIGGDGSDILTGGHGKDVFVLGTGGEDTVTDFTVNIDKLDISDLLDIAEGEDVLANIEDYIDITTDGDDTIISFDIDGADVQAAETVARLEGVNLTTEGTLNDLISDGTIIV